jgi:cell wall assembly regulator SMI1
MKTIWSKVEHELSTKAKAILESMNPPTEEGAIEALEEHIGQELPTDYRDFLLTHDGQSQESNPGFFDMFSLMPLDLVQESWDELETLREDVGEEAACPGDWLPIAEDGTGDLLCVELESGAVSKFISDTDENEDAADSFEGWLVEMHLVMKNGEFAFDSSSGFGIEPKSAEPEDEDEGASTTSADDEDEVAVIDNDDDGGGESSITYKFTAKTIDVFEDREKMSSVQRADIVRVRISSYAGEPLISLNFPDGSDPEEIELTTSITNSADLFKFLAKLKGWDDEAFKEAMANSKGDGEIVVWG